MPVTVRVLPDAEALVGTYLRANLGGVPVSSKVPDPRPAEFVKAWRTGGAARNRVYGDAQITVECWAASKGRASEIARTAQAYILNAAAAEGISECRSVEGGSLYYDPDPDGRAERYSFTCFLSLRAPRSP
jgi:hypothetical protein